MIKYAFYLGLPIIFIIMIMTARAEDTPKKLLESHLWQDRVVVLLSQSADEQHYQKQLHILALHKVALKERDIIIYDVLRYSHVKQDGAMLPHVPASGFFDAFSEQVNDFPYSFIVIGKDSTIKHVSHNVVTSETLFSLIDAMPIRKNETP
jgi:Domain of unknown function (DUF4174)